MVMVMVMKMAMAISMVMVMVKVMVKVKAKVKVSSEGEGVTCVLLSALAPGQRGPARPSPPRAPGAGVWWSRVLLSESGGGSWSS